jgi:hypothetical protein
MQLSALATGVHNGGRSPGQAWALDRATTVKADVAEQNQNRSAFGTRSDTYVSCGAKYFQSVTVFMRIPFGLDRLPKSIGLDDPRLPTASAGVDALRLNTEPFPQAAMPDAVGDHRAQVAAAMDWLISLCGDYAKPRQRFVPTYFAFLAAQIVTHHAVLAENLARYEGLYTPNDWFWSAPRPLPRAWLTGPDGTLQAEVAFWDGTQALAIEFAARNTPRQAALEAAGVQVLRVGPKTLADPEALGAILPAPFHAFWRDQRLPASPFRRPIPYGVLGPATA